MYRELKEKTKIILSDTSYEETICNMLVSMFDYENLPFRKVLIEMLLLTTGNCGLYMDDNELKCGWCTFTGNINSYGFGSDAVIYTFDNKSKSFNSWETSKECVVIFNNPLGTPDYNIEKFAKLLTDVDKSIENAVINTRNTKIYRAHDEKERNAIQNAIDQNQNGKPQAIISSNILSEFLDGENKSNYVVDLTDAGQTDKIQYLSNLHNDLLRRLYNIYGMMSQGSDKIAQQTVAEINNGSSAPFIIPTERLNERIMGVNKINANFGLDIKVDFSEVMKNEYNRIFGSMEIENEEPESEDITDDIIE